MHVRTIQHLDNGGQESQKQVAVYDSDTPVTLKQDQSHQTWYELVDLEQGYYNADWETHRLNSVHEKANDKVFVKSGSASIISLKYV